MRARAIETETYVCASAQTGSFTVGNEQRQTYGHSLVADPWGHVIAKASDGVGVVSARIDPGRVKKVRGDDPGGGAQGAHRPRLRRDHAGTTNGNLSTRSFSATDGLSPEGTAVPATSESITSGALSASVRPLRPAKP